MSNLTKSDDNESFLIHVIGKQTLETFSKAFIYVKANKFNKTTTTSSSKLLEAGITNMRNTCFMSAIIQRFTHILQFVFGIHHCPHSFAPGVVKDFCILCAFLKHIEVVLEPSRSVVILTLLIEILKDIFSYF
ncbi:ubiquitin carboxyl-terminal hydrolase [Trifolium repens]|nr:ubiquitin carboxyl-terminal hydrolase [Trifolium repens]